MTKVLDIQKSIHAANGNISLAKDLFTMLLEDLNNRFQQIESSFQANDIESLAEHAHKLYGATAYCVVPKLRQATHELDKALTEQEHAQLDVLVKALLTEIKQLMREGPELVQQEWT